MKTNKYKILVLSDLSKSTDTILKTSITLAKTIDGEIDFLVVKKPIDMVPFDNQFSAMRSIKEKYKITENKVKALVDSISEEYDFNISFSVGFGNVKNEIERYIVRNQPDIIVLGKQKNKMMKLVGGDLTQFVLKVHKGAVLLASTDSNTLQPESQLSLGVYSEKEPLANIAFAKELLNETKSPVKSFKVVKNKSKETSQSAPKNGFVEYVFEDSPNSINTIDTYVLKNNINLFYIDRGGNTDVLKSNSERQLKEVIEKLNVSVLLPGITKYA